MGWKGDSKGVQQEVEPRAGPQVRPRAGGLRLGLGLGLRQGLELGLRLGFGLGFRQVLGLGFRLGVPFDIGEWQVSRGSKHTRRALATLAGHLRPCLW